MSIKSVSGSYRDPSGSVYVDGDKIIRKVSEEGADQYQWIREKGIIKLSTEAGFLVQSQDVTKKYLANNRGTFFFDCHAIVEHQKIPFISYPYEWSFQQLKKAALHHLDFQVFLLEKNCILKDASAYNVQFIGPQPIFIDLLSIDRYVDGDYWTGYRQFCQQFLYPLLLTSKTGVNFHHFYRGTLEGIDSATLTKLVPLHKKLSPNFLMHVSLQFMSESYSIKNPNSSQQRVSRQAPLSKARYEALLLNLRNWISRMNPKMGDRTVWGNYEFSNTYATNENEMKHQEVKKFIKQFLPSTVLDLGCNSGEFSETAIEAGAKYVVGCDFDEIAISQAYDRTEINQLNILPILMDAANPSPNMGWQQMEREGFSERAKTDGVIALAFIHHLAIGKNIPLEQALKWITNQAPCGIIEFVPKNDPTVKTMLAVRKDVFTEYNETNFRRCLLLNNKIINEVTISESGRKLYIFEVKK